MTHPIIHTNDNIAVKKIHKRQKRLLYQTESLTPQPLSYPKTNIATPATGAVGTGSGQRRGMAKMKEF
jgi:hypothetical protein